MTMQTVCLKVAEGSFEKLQRIISAFNEKEIEITDIRTEAVSNTGFEESLKLHAKYVEIGEIERRFESLIMRGEF